MWRKGVPFQQMVCARRGRASSFCKHIFYLEQILYKNEGSAKVQSLLRSGRQVANPVSNKNKDTRFFSFVHVIKCKITIDIHFPIYVSKNL